MPWQERREMSLKIEFVEKASGIDANVAALCREYGITRETGYKWLKRFREGGYEGLNERSRRPRRVPTSTSEEIVMAVLSAREAHPRWGPKKLVELLKRRLGANTPSRATVARILKRFGQIRTRRRRVPLSVVEHSPNVHAKTSNEIWTVDFKGWWRTGDGERCEPLTVRDAFSRCVLCTRLLEHPTIEAVKEQFQLLFKRFGLPSMIQCDNGEPFVAVRSRAGLTQLSAWWVSLGITVVRSRVGCPQDNGGHERMHRDMKADVQAFPQATRIREQRALERWRLEFNNVRPHEALGGKTPSEVYRPSTTRRIVPLRWIYPPGTLTKRIAGPDGSFSMHGERFTVGRPLVGHVIGIEPINETTVQLWLHDVDLGTLDIGPPPALVDETCQRFIDSKISKTA